MCENDMKINNKATQKVFIMPKVDAKYLNRAKKTELKVLYSIFMNAPDINIKAICEELQESEQAVLEALAFWRCAGIIEDDAETDEKMSIKKNSAKEEKTEQKDGTLKSPSSYTLSEIADIRKRDADFGSLVSYFEKISGHLYNSAEQGIILYLYDTLGIDCEVIMGVAQYCAGLGKNSVRYIQNTVMNITESGVRTYAELENYLEGQKKNTDFHNKVKEIIGANDRALSKAERAHIDKWQKTFGCSEELISFAYEKTVAKINKPQVSYMSKILESWYEKGLKTPEEVEEFFAGSKNKQSGTSSDGRLEFNLDDIFEKPDLS